jgi:4,5-dihydroxyphthalate decarboxylase
MAGEKHLRVALGAYDRTRPLLDGEVGAESLSFVRADTQESTFGLLEGRYDAGEMSLATYAKAREEGDRLQGLPIFTHRKFFHQYVWVRRGSAIRTLADLRGRRVVVPMYWMTSSVWHRMILEDEAGIGARELDWIALAKDRLPSMRPPNGVSVRVARGRSAVELLADAEADALLTAATSADVVAAQDRLERPFADVGSAQRRYYERTGIFPPVHALVCRSELLRERPHEVAALARAIESAKRLAYLRLEDESRTSLPFLREHLDDAHRVFGGDPYPDGFAANRSAIEVFATAILQQGLTERRLTVDELFQPVPGGET